MSRSLLRRMQWIPALVAVAYAALAALHTVGDFDTGWHLATGRWVLEHHRVPATDVLSYTSAGAPWVYPPFAGVGMYALFRQAGYAGLSWLCVAMAAALASYLLWRALPGARTATAVLLMLAVPTLAFRITPRADLFTTLLFAVFLTELWRYHRAHSTRLWLLPLGMLLWVNLHPGFIAGLAMIVAYLLMDLLLLLGTRRTEAKARLTRAWPWLAVCTAAVVANPWGLATIEQAFYLAGMTGVAQDRFVGELSRAPISWQTLRLAVNLRDPESGFWWLAAAAVLAAVYAIRRRESGAAVVLMAALAAALQRLRYQGLFALVVIVIGGTLLAEAFAEFKLRWPRQAWQWAAAVVLALACGVCGLRAADLASNRYYVVSAATTSFGAGEGWWFAERAAEFVERERLPGNIFEPYNLGGFASLRLGPGYPDYIDGRGVSHALAMEEQSLMAQSPDASAWQLAASARNINVILLPLGRYGGLGGFDLGAYCDAKDWQPVYLDEVALVLLRRTEQNRAWLERLAVNCHSAPMQPPSGAGYDFYANSGAVLYALARDGEAEAAFHQALALEPEDPNVHLFLAQLYQHQQRAGDAEREYRTALAGRESSAAWYALGRLLAGEHRWAEAEGAIARAAAMTATPANQCKALGQVQLRLGHTSDALASFGRAEHAGPRAADASPWAGEFRAQVAEGRAEAARQRGEWVHAVELQQQATRQTPSSVARWRKLAELAQAARQGDIAAAAGRTASELEAAAQRP